MSATRPFPLFGAAVAAFALLASAPALAAAPQRPACTLTGSSLDTILTRTRARLAHGRPLTIVAIGSSSTVGVGATSPAGSYPSRLEALLKERFRGIPIRVLNRGVSGEEETDMLARFSRDVIAEKPDLVLWQVASNAVVRGRSVAAEQALIRHGVEWLKSTGTDVVLIDVQYTPLVAAMADAQAMVDAIAAEGKRQDIGVFRRYALMKDWRDSAHMTFADFSLADGLHMNDWAYDCFARNLAAAIIEAAAPPVVASARTAPAR